MLSRLIEFCQVAVEKSAWDTATFTACQYWTRMNDVDWFARSNILIGLALWMQPCEGEPGLAVTTRLRRPAGAADDEIVAIKLC